MASRVAALTLLAGLALARAAAAVTVDGQLDAAYGTALVTQTTQTGLDGGQITGDSDLGDLDFANGSELDGAFATVTGDTLYLFLAGNLAMLLNVNQNKTVGHVLDVFLDSAPGGQNQLSGLGAGNPLNGLTFDAGFAADHWLELVGDAGGSQGPPTWQASHAELPPDGSGTLTFLGWSSAGGPGTLTGGTNPHGILATIDNRNVAGVTSGCDAASGAGVTRGIEWAIPLAAVGSPAGCFQVTVLVRAPGATSPVSNQLLGPAPPGTCPLGEASLVNLANLPGAQSFSVCPASATVPAASPRARLELLGPEPNPSRGDRVRVAFRLADAGPATLRMLDGAGRVVRERTVTASPGGFGVAELSEGRRVPAGMYWLVLSQGGSRVSRRCAVVR